MRKCLHSIQLMYIWRVLNPTTKDFTYFSSVHRCYSHIDLFLAHHKSPQLISKAEIGSMGMSDHAAVSIEMKGKEVIPRQWQWRLNIAMFGKAESRKEVEKELANHFLFNCTEDVALFTIWEAHKSFMRGVFIKMGLISKKQRSKNKIFT